MLDLIHRASKSNGFLRQFAALGAQTVEEEHRPELVEVKDTTQHELLHPVDRSGGPAYHRVRRRNADILVAGDFVSGLPSVPGSSNRIRMLQYVFVDDSQRDVRDMWGSPGAEIPRVGIFASDDPELFIVDSSGNVASAT